MAESFSREKSRRAPQKEVDEKPFVTSAGTSNEFDVQNKLGRKHTDTTHIVSLVHNNTSLRKHHSKRTQHARGQAVMKGGDNVGGASNDVGGGASSGAAADPSAPSDGAAAAAGGGGVVNNSSPVVEDGNGLTATTQTVHSQNGTPVTVKTAAGNRAKRS